MLRNSTRGPVPMYLLYKLHDEVLCGLARNEQRRVPQIAKLFCKKLFRLFPLPCEARHLAGGLLGLPDSQPAGGVGNKAKRIVKPVARIRGARSGLRRDDPPQPSPGLPNLLTPR